MSPTAVAALPEVTVDDAPQELATPTTLTDTRELAIEAFMRKTGETRELVAGFVDSIGIEVLARVDHLKHRKQAGWHPNTAWLKVYHDAVLEPGVPDDTASTPGSPHARLEEHVGELVDYPVTLTHTKTEGHGKTFCCVHFKVAAT